MNKFLLFLCLIQFVFFQNVLAQDLIFSSKTDAIHFSLYNPSDFKIVDDTTLLISDNTTDFPIYLVELTTDEIISKISKGNGPGELSTMYKNISITQDKIFVWDYGNQLLNYYDRSLNYMGSKAFDDLGTVYNLVLNDKYIYFFDSSNDFIKMYDFDSDTIRGDKRKSYSLSDHAFFDQFKIMAIRQAFEVTVDENNNLIAGNEFTSLIFSVNKDNIEFNTISPFQIVQEVQEGIFTNTDLLYNELCTLDIEHHKGNIYALSKGEKADETHLTKTYNNNVDEYLEDFINSNQLLVYDGKSGYQGKIDLPEPAKKVEFFDNKMYVLQTIGGIPEIKSYVLE